MAFAQELEHIAAALEAFALDFGAAWHAEQALPGAASFAVRVEGSALASLVVEAIAWVAGTAWHAA